MPAVIGSFLCNKPCEREHGFSLIELLFALIVIAVIATVSIYFYQDYDSGAEIGAALAEITVGKNLLETQVNGGLVGPMTRGNDNHHD